MGRIVYRYCIKILLWYQDCGQEFRFAICCTVFPLAIFSEVSVRFAFTIGSVSICDLAWHIPEGLALSRHMYKHIHVLFGVFGRLARFGIYCLVTLALSKPMHRAVDNIGKAVGERQDAGAHTIANASHDVSTRTTHPRLLC